MGSHQIRKLATSWLSYHTCPLGKYGIIWTSNRAAGWRKGDTLIRRKNRGGFHRSSYKNVLPKRGESTLTFNQGVVGSNPTRLTKASKPSLARTF
jgi:hypothetical protein